MVYGSETWAVRVEDMRRLERAERVMVRWMCGVTIKARKPTEELLERMGIETVVEVVKRSRLRWFGHVERLSADNWVSVCRGIEVEESRGRGRGKKTWNESMVERHEKASTKDRSSPG